MTRLRLLLRRWLYANHDAARLLHEQISNLNSRVFALQAENATLRSQRDLAMQEALASSRAVANWLALQTTRLPIFDGIGPTLPTPAEPHIPAPLRAVRDRDAARRSRTEFLEQLAQANQSAMPAQETAHDQPSGPADAPGPPSPERP